MRTGPGTISLLAVVVVVAAACTATDDARSTSAAPEVVDALSEIGVATTGTPGSPAAPTALDASVVTRTPPGTPPVPLPELDFTARRLDGGTLHGARLAGRDVALWMWAPWCPQCNREAPHVASAAAAFGDRVAFVGMAGHDTDEAHRAFVDEHGLDHLLHVVDDDGSLWARFGVSYQPAWVFVDDDGTMRTVAGGLYEDLEARLQALVDG